MIHCRYLLQRPPWGKVTLTPFSFIFKRAVRRHAAQPGLPDPHALHREAIQRWQAGDAGGARDLLQAAIALNPHVAAFHANLALVLKGQATPEERIKHYRRAIEIDASDANTYANLAAVLSDQQDYAGAEECARRAIAIAPQHAESWFNLGGALDGQQRCGDAGSAYDSAARLKPNWPQPHYAAAKAYQQDGRLGLSAQRYHEALACCAGLSAAEQAQQPLAALHHALGSVLAALRQFEPAEANFRAARLALPDDLPLLIDLGNALNAQGKHDEAVTCYQQVVAAAPHLAGGHVNLGAVAQTLGRHEEAIAHYQAGLQRDPSLVALWSNLLVSLSYSLRCPPAELREMFRAFDRQIAQPLHDAQPYANLREPARRLRVGYVSPDFRRHAVAYFALPLLAGHHGQQLFLGLIEPGPFYLRLHHCVA